MPVVVKRSEAIYIFPHCGIRSMKQVRAVCMNFDASSFIKIRICVAAGMQSSFKKQYVESRRGRTLSYGKSEQARADDNDVSVRDGFT